MICGSSIVESLILFYALYAITLLFEKLKVQHVVRESTISCHDIDSISWHDNSNIDI